MYHQSGPRLTKWRHAIGEVADRAHDGPPLDSATMVEALFYMPRPKYHFGANGILPRYAEVTEHTVTPDGDKLLRAVLDALHKESSVLADDARAFDSRAAKLYSDGTKDQTDYAPGAQRPGLHLVVGAP